MPTTVKPISDQWRRHVYTDDLPPCPLAPDADPARPFKALGVTSHIKPLKHDFSDHATKVVARWAVEHRHVWADLSVEAAVTLIAGERDRALNSAANRGSDLHRAVEAHAGGATALTILDPNAAPYLPSVERFVTECRPEFIWSEVAVFHRGENYAGASDGVGRLLAYPELGVLQFDWKSREKAQVYETEAPQLAAYARAQYGILDGKRVPLPQVDGGMVVCFTPEGYELFPVDIDHAWPVFLAAKNLYAIKGEAKKACGSALVKKSAERAEASASVTPTASAASAPTVDLFADGPGASPSVPGPSALRADLEQRAKTIMRDYPDGIPTLAAQVAARGLQKLSETPDDQLGSWLLAVKDAESDLRVPWPEEPLPTPRAPATVEPRGVRAPVSAPVVGLPASDPAVQAVIERCKALPSDLLAAVEANTVGAGKCPNLISGRATQADLALVDEQVTLAEGEHEGRKAYVASLLQELGDEAVVTICAEAAPGRELELLTEGDVERVGLLVDAIERLVVAFAYDGDKPVLTTFGGDAEAALVAAHGSKSAALTVARAAAAAHGRPAPRSVAAAAADPLVVAASLPLTNPTTQQEKQSA